MNRSEKIKERKKQVEHQKDIQAKEEIALFRKRAEICRRLINDKRHVEFKLGIEARIEEYRREYENLGDSVKDNDELLRKSLILTTQIKALQWVLYEPYKIVGIEDKFKGEKK
jgi:hypothetical protein